MRCSNCGHIIPSGKLYCAKCGQEVRIVPDYNPLDEMLTAQIKISIDDNNSVKQQQHNKRNTRTIDEREARRRQAERRRELKRKKRRRLLILMAVIFVAFIGLGILLYVTSYTGIVKKGNKALSSLEYTIAQEKFEKAIEKKPEQEAAYIGLSKVYIAKNDITGAENLFLDAIGKYPKNVSIHEALIQFYLDTNQELKIPLLLNDAEKKIKDSLKDYIVSKPTYSLETGRIYDDVQQLTLTSDEETIYYTVDGTNPTLSSAKYTQPLQLDEGETVVKSISVNKKGVPSLPAEKTYVIQLPIEDAPAISPSTGHYDRPTKIEIKVPDGYTAYYTTDGSNPTTASTKYSGPINMPENDTLFKAVLVNAGGRYSGVTTRNYILEIPEAEE